MINPWELQKIEWVKKMKKVDRNCGAVFGVVIADAASRPLHWNDDRERIESLLKQDFSQSFGLPVNRHFTHFQLVRSASTLIPQSWCSEPLQRTVVNLKPLFSWKKAEDHFGFHSASRNLWRRTARFFDRWIFHWIHQDDIRAGVCNCSRVIQVGAIYGALSGVETILQDLDTENSCLESVKPSFEWSVSHCKVRLL